MVYHIKRCSVDIEFSVCLPLFLSLSVSLSGARARSRSRSRSRTRSCSCSRSRSHSRSHSRLLSFIPPTTGSPFLTDRQTDKQTDRQTQTDRERERQRGRETERETEREKGERDRETNYVPATVWYDWINCNVGDTSLFVIRIFSFPVLLLDIRPLHCLGWR